MSLTISPHVFAEGFNPKAYPIVVPPKGASSNLGANTNLNTSDLQVDLSHLEVIKIIPEGGTDGGNQLSSGRSLINHKTVLNSNANSDELVEKIIDPETGENPRNLGHKSVGT